MTSGTRNTALAVLLVVIAGVAVYWTFFKGPVLEWDGSAGATYYEVQIDGTLLGTFTETRASLPRGRVRDRRPHGPGALLQHGRLFPLAAADRSVTAGGSRPLGPY